ncbi:MAG TPA: TetR family transcriptional regulator [Sphingomonas sp.]
MERPYHHGDLARAALDAAEALLVEDGPDAVTMRAVAVRAGVTHRALYRWHPDRDALLSGLAARGFERLARAVGRADGAEAFVSAYLAQALAEPALYRLAMSRQGAMTNDHPALRDARDAVVRACLRTFGEGDADARDDVVALWSLLHGAVTLWEAGLIAARDEAAFAAYAAGLARRFRPL